MAKAKEEDNTNKADSNPPVPKKNKKVIAIVTLIFVVIGGLIFFWWLFWGRFVVSTEDAYVHGNQVTLTPQIPGIVTQVNVNDSS